jgi:DNA repair ATPase RecN
MATPADPNAHRLKDTLDRTSEVAADVQSAANQVGVIGTVLAQELPDELQVGEVAQALGQTEELEQKLAESAETLADVTAALEHEIQKRHEADHKLAHSRAQVKELSEQVQQLPDKAG